MDRKQGNRRLDIQNMDRVEDNRKLDTAGAEELKNQDPDRDLMWELVRSEHLVKDEWMDFRRETYRFPDRREKGPFYNYSCKSYAVVVAQDEEGKFLCVRQYRHGIGAVTTEFPAGGLECPDGRSYPDRGEPAVMEDPLAAAKRELREETGYVSDGWKHLLTVPSNATRADNYAHLYYAGHCRKEGTLQLDDTEFLNVHRLTSEEIQQLIDSGKFQQAIHILAFLLARKESENY